MESSELFKWADDQLKKLHPHTTLEITNFSSDWADGVLYHAILYNYRPDLIDKNFCGKTENLSGKNEESSPFDTLADSLSNAQICRNFFDIVEKELNIRSLVDENVLKDKQSSLENITFVGELYQYFNSKNYVFDKELGASSKMNVYESLSDSETATPRLSAKLFNRKPLEERIMHLNNLDGITLYIPSETDEIIEEEIIEEIIEPGKTRNLESSFAQLHAANNPFADSDNDSEEDIDESNNNNQQQKSKVYESRKSYIKEKDDSDDENLKKSDDEVNDTNPFGDSEEESEKSEKVENSTNPFGDDLDEADGSETGGNPFGSDVSEDDEELPGNPFGEPAAKPPRPIAPPRRPPPPSLTPKKKKAPLPPKDQIPYQPGRPRRPPPPKPKGEAPGHGHPLIKRGVDNNEQLIKNEMNEIENEMKLLEAQGAKLEDMLRFSNNSDNWGKDDDGLMKEWLTIVKKRNHLGRRDTELGYRLRLTRLELKHAELEFEMRKLLNKQNKTDDEEKTESDIMDQIVLIVNKKDKIVQNIEIERERAQIEDCAMAIDNKIQIKEKKKSGMKKLKSVLIKKKDKKDKVKPEKVKKVKAK